MQTNAIIKVKIYPKPKQEEQLKKSLGDNRFIWNELLAIQKQRLKNKEPLLSYAKMCKEITKLKQQHPFLYQTSNRTLQQTARKLYFAIQSWRRKHTAFPKFKKKKRYEGILILPKDFRFNGRYVRIPKIGWLRIKDKATSKSKWQIITQNTKQVWIKQEPDGFYAYILYIKETKPLPKTGKAVGIDLGIKNTITTSERKKYRLPIQKLKTIIARIEYLQSIIDKKKHINKQRGLKPISNRVKRLMIRRDKLIKRIINIKHDFYHKSSTEIVKNHDYLAVEDLNLKEMQQREPLNHKKANKKLHKDMHTIALSHFIRLLEYKAEWYGREIIKVNPQNTSKICSRCGYLIKDIDLSVRTIKCPVCGLEEDRDVNASINILNRALALSSGQGEYRREMVA